VWLQHLPPEKRPASTICSRPSGRSRG
jgi:hypothetical protein